MFITRTKAASWLSKQLFSTFSPLLKPLLWGEIALWLCARPNPCTISTITYKIIVYAPAERPDQARYTFPISTLLMFSVGVPVCQAQSRILSLGNQIVCHNTFYSSKNMVLGKMWFSGRNDTFWYIHRHPNQLNADNFPWQNFFSKVPVLWKQALYITRPDGNSSAAACLLWPPLLAAACPPAWLWDRAWGGGKFKFCPPYKSSNLLNTGGLEDYPQHKCILRSPLFG